jgi:hypothetical protein
MSRIKVTTRRGANMVAANPQRLTSDDGSRWATGRHVKGETSEPGIYRAVEVWTLKHRVNGKAVTVKSGVDRESAEKWVAG